MEKPPNSMKLYKAFDVTERFRYGGILLGLAQIQSWLPKYRTSGVLTFKNGHIAYIREGFSGTKTVYHIHLYNERQYDMSFITMKANCIGLKSQFDSYP